MILEYNNNFSENVIFLGDRLYVTKDCYDYYNPTPWAIYKIKRVNRGFKVIFKFDFDMNNKWQTKEVYLKDSEYTISYRERY